MAEAEANALQEIIENAKAWPIWNADVAGTAGSLVSGTYAQAGLYGVSQRDIALWIAMRESDRARLRAHVNWPADRRYRIDPLPERIANAFSDLLFGQEPEFKAPVQGDQERLDEIVRENGLASELRRAVATSVSEGEVWWRCYTDMDISDYPIIDFHSRLNVIPYFIGRRVAAAAFVEDLFTQEITVEHRIRSIVYRHIEIQTDQLTRNFLYKGQLSSLGERVPLTDLPETRSLPEEWDHGLPVMLAGRIPNKIGRDWRLGISDYEGIKDFLLDLNEAHSIMAENARNTAKARMVVPANSLDENGVFDAGKDVIVHETLDDQLDPNAKSGPYAVLEYTFQAGPLLQHMDNLTSVALTRVGLAEQFVGGGRQQSEATAYTGTALRTRLIPTTLAGSGKGKFYDDEVPKMLYAFVLVDNLPEEEGGCGRSWSNTTDKPIMKRSSVLPEDQNEETQRVVMGVQGEVMSIRTAVEDLHPDWDDEDVEEEVEKIREDRGGGPAAADDPNAPNLPPEMGGEPGDQQPGANNVIGARQPGAIDRGTTPDGQSPGRRPPRVVAGGPH